MKTRIFVKPAVEGSVVYQPDRDMRPLDADGEWVANSLLWQRMILNGDVVEAAPPKQTTAKASTKE